MTSAISRLAPGRWLRAVTVIGLGLCLTACASFYVDTAIGDLTPLQRAQVQNAKPVAVDLTFQTNGNENPRGATTVLPWVTRAVTESGAFSEVADSPGADVATLEITINNVANISEAIGRGFVTGLTFGAAGNAVTDGYVCTATYHPAGGGAPIQATATHAIHTTIGAKGAPAGAVRSVSIMEALETMTRQLTANCINNLARDPAFSR